MSKIDSAGSILERGLNGIAWIIDKLINMFEGFLQFVLKHWITTILLVIIIIIIYKKYKENHP